MFSSDEVIYEMKILRRQYDNLCACVWAETATAALNEIAHE